MERPETISQAHKKSFEHSFNFDTFGNYMNTTVTLTATLPFQKLHLLFTLPGIILRAYWDKVWYGHDFGNGAEETKADLNECSIAEKDHWQNIKAYTEAVDRFARFPNMIKPLRAPIFPYRKLTLKERLLGRVIYPL